MKLTIKRDDLLHLCELCSEVGGKGAAYHGTDRVQLTASLVDGLGTLQGYSRVPAGVSVETAVLTAGLDQAGEVVVSTKHLTSVVAAMSAEVLGLAPNRENSRLIVSAVGGKRRRYELPLAAEGCASLGEPVEPPEAATRRELPASLLLELLGRVKHAAAPEGESQLHMQAISFEVKDGHAGAVACDGHRMAMATAEVPAGTEFSGLLTRRFVALVGAVCKQLPRDATVTLIQGSNSVFLETPSTLVSGELPLSPLPPVRQHYESLDKRYIGTLPREPLVDALRGVLAARFDATQESNLYPCIRLALGKGKNVLRVYLEGYSVEAEDEVPFDALNDDGAPGDGFDVGYEPEYLTEAVRASGQHLNVQLVQMIGGQDALTFESPGYAAWIAPRVK